MLPTLYAIIPVYNEAANLLTLIESLSVFNKKVTSEFNLQVIFVDDGSTDSTADAINMAAHPYIHVLLANPVNRGPGFAFGCAFEYLSSRIREHDWVFTMEGDNTSTSETLEHMLVRRKEGYDVVMASPYLYSGGFARVSLLRTIISHAGNTLVKIILRLRGIMTFSCFLRLYSGSTILKLQETFGPRIIEFPGFECMVELLAKSVYIQSRISEVEMVVNWGKRTGKSKMKIIKTSLGYLRLFMRRSRMLRVKE